MHIGQWIVRTIVLFVFFNTVIYIFRTGFDVLSPKPSQREILFFRHPSPQGCWPYAHQSECESPSCTAIGMSSLILSSIS